MTEYLIRFVQVHETFRRPELEALARYAGVEVETLFYSTESPFCIVRFHAHDQVTNSTGKAGAHPEKVAKTVLRGKEADTAARDFISRSILAKGIYELWGQGNDYADLHADVRRRTQHRWLDYLDVSFKFSVDTYCGKRTTAEQREIIDKFAYLGFKGKISMSNPDEEFVVFEEWELLSSEDQSMLNDGNAKQVDIKDLSARKRNPKQLYFARYIGGTKRHLAEKHDLKKRPYISTTSMDAELALVTVTLALAGPGKYFLDPFVGTGGFLVAAAELGAVVLGSDIDGRSFRGKGHGLEKGVGMNFRKYGLQHFFGDCIISDLTNTPLRTSSISSSDAGRWINGLVCDPPYGVREGLKVLGKRTAEQSPILNGDSLSRRATHAGPFLVDGVPAHTLPGFVAPKRPYSFTLMLADILEFAANTLVDGGRLAFWMPSADEAEEDFPPPLHPLLELKHVCVQSFNKWSRKLLVYERRMGGVHRYGLEMSTDHHAVQAAGRSADELNPFRKRYFQGFVGASKS